MVFHALSNGIGDNFFKVIVIMEENDVEILFKNRIFILYS